MKRSLPLLLSLFTAVTCAGQQIDLAPLNAAFAGTVVFKIDKQDRFVMDFMDESGRFRQDIVPLIHLDPEAVHYSAEEKAVVLECGKDHAQCFTKEIFKLDVVRLTSRSTLPNPDKDPEGANAIALFKDLIRTALSELKQTADETSPDRTRKKPR